MGLRQDAIKCFYCYCTTTTASTTTTATDDDDDDDDDYDEVYFHVLFLLQSTLPVTRKDQIQEQPAREDNRRKANVTVTVNKE